MLKKKKITQNTLKVENKTLKTPQKIKVTEEKLRRLLRPKIFYGFFVIPSTLGKKVRVSSKMLHKVLI